MFRTSCILILVFASLIQVAFAQDVISVIPNPKQVRLQKGVLELHPGFFISANDDRLKPQISYLQKAVFDLNGIYSAATEKAESSIYLVLKHAAPHKATEAYTVKINRTQVVIEASAAEGIFNGIQTLLQIIRSSSEKNKVILPQVEIHDVPEYSWRGLMLDESRHFFGMEKVKSILDWMALYKLNRFHWHLTDEPGWRLEIKKYPRLTLVGGIGSFTDPDTLANYYTQQQIKEVVAYAAERFITVIPEIDMPGHGTAANRAYPEFSGGGSKDHPDFTFNPGYEKTYEYLANILKETQILFPGQMIHLGGDEVSFGNEQWNKDPLISTLKSQFNLKTNLDVEKYFIKRMADSVFAFNSKVIVWDEMVNAGLPKDKTIVFWWRHDKPQQLKEALKSGYQTVLSPRLPLYFDFVQDSTHRFGRKWGNKFNDILSVYKFAPNQYLEKGFSKSNILGIQANLWTETVHNNQRLDYLLFPRIAALAEAAWTDQKDRNEKQFLIRLQPHLTWYQESGINYFNPFQPLQIKEPQGRSKAAPKYID